MTTYNTYAAVNQRLANGEQLYIDGGAQRDRISPRPQGRARAIRYPRIGIYTGAGASHSWLWYVDMFDRMGFYDITFLGAAEIQGQGLAGIDVLTVSGGDTFAIAKALQPSGADRLRDFIITGGLYIGACAGAYLVMNSSKPHLKHFNFTGTKITNLSKKLPQCRQMPHKFALAYGCDFIFHPVRETVRMKTTAHLPFAPERTVEAPLYGGAGMQAPDDAQVLALYQDFTTDTVFLVDRDLAQETLVGKAAALRAPMGKGWLYLCGPHFEHPRFPASNALLADAIYWDNQCRSAKLPADDWPELLSKTDSRSLLQEIKREVSNARISASGLEMQPIRWLIGAKFYEPEKIRVFLEAIWYRLKRLEKLAILHATWESAAHLRQYANATTALVRQLKQHVSQGGETNSLAAELFSLLQSFAVTFLDLYFQTIREPTPNRRS